IGGAGRDVEDLGAGRELEGAHRPPPPALVGAEGEDAVQEVVATRDRVEHRPRAQRGVHHGETCAFRAWSFMWPRWMPSPAGARRAGRLEARPQAARTTASSRAEPTPTSSNAARTPACARVEPPTVAAARGSVSSPARKPSTRRQVASAP